MRTVFISQNEFGLICLKELIDVGADVRQVVTKPPRSRISDQESFDTVCNSHDIPVAESASVNDPEVIEKIQSCDPELLFVIGWSELVSKRILATPSVAALGMHPAPLPRGRGRAPLAWSLIKGLDETALTLFHLVEEADAGDIVAQKPMSITIEDDAGSMYGKMIKTGREIIQEFYPQFEDGTAPRKPQDDDEATWWPRRQPEHGAIDWNQSQRDVYNWIRGQSRPYPGAFSYIDQKKVTVWQADPPDQNRTFASPGEIMYRDGDALGVGVWEGVVELTEVQVGDDDPIPAGMLLEQYALESGDEFRNVRFQA